MPEFKYHALSLDELQTTDYERPADRSIYTEIVRKERKALDPRTNGPFLDDVHDAHNSARREGKALDFITDLGERAINVRTLETHGDRQAGNLNVRQAETHDPEKVENPSNPNVRPRENQTFSKRETSETEKRQAEADKNAKKVAAKKAPAKKTAAKKAPAGKK